MARKDEKERVGDVLGLGDIASTPAANDEFVGNEEVVGYEPESEAARRRQRMNEGADELTPTATPPHRGSGATGIDMGSGGEGTDLE